MKIKKYVASSMPEAIKQIRAELGSEAVILNSKVVHHGGFLGFFRKKNIEVIAAVDHVPKSGFHEKEKRVSVSPPPPAGNILKEEHSHAEKAGTAPAISVEKRTHPESRTDGEKEVASAELMSEIHDLKHLLQSISFVTSGNVKYPQHIAKINDLLIRQEIDRAIRDEIIQELLVEWYRQGASASYEQVLSWCKDILTKRIAGCRYGGINFSKKFVSVIGPTGVGKTTTLAKIAAECTLKYRKKAGFITTDTYRIAAIDQLKTYAKILTVPLEVCYDLDDFRRACRNFSDLDIIFIDTAGRNYRNAYYIKELENVIDFNEALDTYLVLSLTSKQRDMEEVYSRFAGIPVKQFIFTKMDETSNIGPMYNMIAKYQKGVAYITNGQSVPDDIMTASAEGIVKSILEVERQ